MNLVILDSEGNEVTFERVSLIPGGIEITLGDMVTTSVPITPAVDTTMVDALPSAADVAAHAPSVFNTPAVGQQPIQSPDPVDLVDPVDKQGVPWDERIHSSSKKQSAKGLWAKRRNLAEGVYEQITAELLSGQPQPEPTPVSDERLAPITPEVPNVPAPTQSVPELPVEQAAAGTAPEVPEVPAGSAVPTPPAPLPDDNQIGDANDSALSGILSAWGSNS